MCLGAGQRPEECAANLLGWTGDYADPESFLGGVLRAEKQFGLDNAIGKKLFADLDKALALDPQGPQQNLSLAWLSFKEKDHAAALRLATAASNAPARPGREKADADLRERATSLIAAVNDKAR